MNDIDIMQQNLARMLSEHLSHPSIDTTEPADPFQKRTFGKKLRKSAVSIIEEHRTASLPKLDEALFRNVQGRVESRVQERVEVDEEAEMYMREVEVLMARLRVGLQKVEECCRERVHRICTTSSGKIRKQKAETILSEMEASIDFITNDCFAFEGKINKDKQNRHEKDNRDIRDNRPEKDMKKGTISTSKITKVNEKINQRHQKSIYQSVLQQRKLRRSKKRMI